ncbi:hypothetical protein BsWGS_19473 [Bradybaena similaris]
MAKRKKPRAALKKDKIGASATKPEESPSPAKKIAAVSSTSQQGEGHVSSFITWPVDHESPSEAPVSPSGYFCTCCNFSTGKRSMLDEHMQQHKLKCPWCPFSSLTHLEVIHHCKFKHDKSTEIDSDPCHACIFCDFMTYIMVCLEAHTALKHPGEPVKYIPKLISKQVSADVRREDAVFSQSLHNENARFSIMKIEAGSQSGAKSNPIIIDGAEEVSRNIKLEANSGSVSEKCVKTADLSTDSINKQLLVSYIFSDIEASKDLKSECGSVETNLEVRVADAPCVEVKLEKLYCLTCPFNSVSIDEVKSHTVSQHPVGPAAATYNSKGESVSVNDTSFFCVRQSCTFSSFNYASYQKHLIDCCAGQKKLTVLDATRLETTIQYILDCQKRYNLIPEDNFCQFASSCLGFSVPTYQVVVSTPGSLWSQSSLASSNEHVNKSSVVSSDHSSSPVTTFNHIPPHNPQTASAGMQLTCGQQGNIHSQYPTYLGTAPQMQCNPGVPNSHATSPALEDTRDQFGSILDTFSLSNASSNAPLYSSSLPPNAPFYSSHTSSYVPLNSNSAPSNVSINSSNLPSNVQNISRNALSNVPMNSSHAPSIGNGRLLQPHQIPGNNLTNVLPDQIGNEKQRATSYAGQISQGMAANAHNFLVGTNLVSLASQHQPGVLINSGQCDVKAGSQSQPSMAINSSAHINQSQTSMPINSAAYINHSTGNITQNLSLNTAPVSHAGQHRPGILTNSGQNHWSVSGNLNYTSEAGQPNTQGHEKVGSTYQTLPVGQSNSIANRMVSGNPSGIFIATDTAVGVKHISPASQSNTARGSAFFGQESGNLMAVGLNQGTIGNMNHTFPANQYNTIDGRTVFGQQSGSVMTASHNQGGYHTPSQYNTVAGRAVQVGQSGILTTTGLKQYPSGNQTYVAPAGQPGTSLSYGQQRGNFTTASLNHSVIANQNQSTPAHGTGPIVRQETYQKQQCNINPNDLGSSTQEDTSSPNTILVFNMSGSKSRPHELAYSNLSQSPSASFHQTQSMNSQNQTMIQNIPLAKSAEQSGIDSQTGTPKLQPTARCPSVEQNSRGQISRSLVSQSGQFSSRSGHVGSYSGLQTADGAGNNRPMCSALSEHTPNIHVEPGATAASPVLSLETNSVHPSHLNQATHALSSVSVHNGSRMAASPQQANSVRPVKIASLPPSIHRQSPAAAMIYTRSRGAALTGKHPRSSPALVASQSHQRGVACRRQISRGRGQARSPRLLSGSTRGSHNSVNCSDGFVDDDVVIVTSGFSAEDKQKPYQQQSRHSGARLPVNQQRTCTASSEDNHHDTQISKTHVTACSSQTPRPLQSRKRVDVEIHFENIVSTMNTSANVEKINVSPEDDVEILSVVAGQSRDGAILGTGLEMPQKARPSDNQMSGRNQNNSVDWNLKDNFSSGLNDVFNDIVNSSMKTPSRPPSNSQSSNIHSVPPQREAPEGNMPLKQQSLVRPPADSQQKQTGNNESAFHHPSKENLQARSGVRQILPAGLSSSLSRRQPVQQPPTHPAQFQQVAGSRASPSNATSSKLPAQTRQHPSVIILDNDCPAPSRETSKSYSASKESRQKVVEMNITTQFGKPQTICENRELPPDVIVLDADPSQHWEHTETNNFKTTNPTEDVIILDTDFSEKLLDKGNNSSQVVPNTPVARSTYSPLSSTPRPPQPVRQNVSKTQIYAPRGQVQHFTLCHPRAALFNSRFPPKHEQHSSAGSNSVRPAIRSTVRTPRATSVSPVLVRHPNHPNSIITQKGPQSALRGINVQNRNGSQTIATTSVNEFSNSSAVSANVPAASVSPVSASHPNHPNTTIAQGGPQSMFRGTNLHDRNRPETVTTVTYVSQLTNSSAVSTNAPLTSNASFVAKSELTIGWSEKAAPKLRLDEKTIPQVMQGKNDAPQVMLGPGPPQRSQLVKDPSCEDSHVNLKENTQLLEKKGNQSKVPDNLPALLLAKFKQCSNLKILSSVQRQSAAEDSTVSICGQRTFLDASAKQTVASPKVSSSPGESSDKAEKVFNIFQAIPSLLEQPAGALSFTEEVVQEVTDLSQSNNMTLSEMDTEQIFIFDLDNENESTLSAMNSEEIIIFDIDVVNKQEPECVSVLSNQLSDQQNMILNASDLKIIQRSIQFSTVTDSTGAITSTTNINLQDSILVPEKSTLAGANSTVGENCPADLAQAVQRVEQNSSHVHNQVKDPPGAHNQLKNLQVFHNQRTDSPMAENPPVLHSQLEDSPVAYNQLKDPPILDNQLTKSSSTSNQTIPSGSIADNIKVSPRERKKSRKGIKKDEVDEAGQLPLEKKTKQRPKKTVNVENESDNKVSAIEETPVRHSERLMKTVIKNFKSKESDIDLQLSDGSEFHLEDEELLSDSDSEWSDSPEKNNKMKPKKAKTPPDPTAFNISARGNFKCWLCQKIYSRCTFAKHHMVTKHLSGLCAIDIGHSIETNSVCLLMFCPRSCKYATSTLVAMNSHMKTCNKPFLTNQGSNYIEMHKDFLDQKYIELLNWPLQTLVNSITARKTKNPAKVPKAKKPKAALGTGNIRRPSCETSQIPMLSPNTSVVSCESRQTVMHIPNTHGPSSGPMTAVRHAAADGTLVSGASQNQSSFTAPNKPAQQPNLGQKHPRQRPNPCIVNNSPAYIQHPVTPTSRPVVSRNVPPNSRKQNVQARPLPPPKSPAHQFSTSSFPAPAQGSASHHVAQSCRMEECTENGEIYLVEENGIICLE